MVVTDRVGGHEAELQEEVVVVAVASSLAHECLPVVVQCLDACLSGSYTRPLPVVVSPLPAVERCVACMTVPEVTDVFLQARAAPQDAQPCADALRFADDLAGRVGEAARPPKILQVGHAGRLVGEHPLEVDQGVGERLRHAGGHYIWGVGVSTG